MPWVTSCCGSGTCWAECHCCFGGSGGHDAGHGLADRLMPASALGDQFAAALAHVEHIAMATIVSRFRAYIMLDMV